MKVRCTTGTGDNRPASAAPGRDPDGRAPDARDGLGDLGDDRPPRRQHRPHPAPLARSCDPVELEVSGADADGLRRDLVREAAVRGVDVAVSPSGLARRGRRLVVMDVDSTLIKDEVIELLARHAGREAEVAAVTAAAMAGELDFAESLHERVAAARRPRRRRARAGARPGAPHARRPHALPDAAPARLHPRPGVRRVAEIVEPLGRELDCRYVRANRLEVVDGRLTGRIDGPMVDRRARPTRCARSRPPRSCPWRGRSRSASARQPRHAGAGGLVVTFNAKPVVRPGEGERERAVPGHRALPARDQTGRGRGRDAMDCPLCAAPEAAPRSSAPSRLGSIDVDATAPTLQRQLSVAWCGRGRGGGAFGRQRASRRRARGGRRRWWDWGRWPERRRDLGGHRFVADDQEGR